MTKYCLAICGLLTFSIQTIAADLFENSETLVVELSGPLHTLLRNKEDRQEYPFVLSANGLNQTVMVRARGNSRMGICDFPPLRIQFNLDTSEQSVFAGQDSLKLVTHCHDSERAQANTLQEFAAYQIFKLMSETAYRVRLLHITFTDTEGNKSTTRYGFLIESTGAMAKRVGGTRAHVPAVSLKSLNDQQEALVYVFQYLIANTDWSMVSAEGDDECCHNGKLIKKNHELFYVPYDFDMSGLVNAKYAQPDGSLRIKRVTQRLYRGFCLDQEALRHAIQTTRSHQDDFKTIVDKLPAMSEKERKKTDQFLERFFEAARDEEKILRLFEKRCLD